MVERFDTRTLQLTVLPPLPQGRQSPGVLATPGMLHVFGGIGSDGAIATRVALALTGAARWIEEEEPSVYEPLEVAPAGSRAAGDFWVAARPPRPAAEGPRPAGTAAAGGAGAGRCLSCP